MQLFELLKNDHREIQEILQLLIGQREKSWDSVKSLCEKLKLHIQLEELYFYPVLKDYPETEALINASYREHLEAKELLRLLLEENLDEDELASKLDMLQIVTLHHIKDEENRVFLQAQRVLSEEQITEIGNSIELKRKEVLSRL